MWWIGEASRLCEGIIDSEKTIIRTSSSGELRRVDDVLENIHGSNGEWNIGAVGVVFSAKLSFLGEEEPEEEIVKNRTK